MWLFQSVFPILYRLINLIFFIIWKAENILVEYFSIFPIMIHLCKFLKLIINFKVKQKQNE